MSGWGLAGGKDLRRISLELRRMDDKTIKKKLRRELVAAAAPMVPAVRAAIGAIPVKGTSGSTGLRKRLQKATRLRVRTVGRQAGVAILVDPKRMPDGQKALPKYMEGLKPWRHPVFADDPNRQAWTWVSQTPRPYFFRTVRPLGLRSKIAVSKVVTDITHDIT
jgi:hypothetical protein